MKITAQQYSVALYRALEEAGPAVFENILENFVQILRQNGHIPMFERIKKYFFAYDRKMHGVTDVDYMQFFIQ